MGQRLPQPNNKFMKHTYLKTLALGGLALLGGTALVMADDASDASEQSELQVTYQKISTVNGSEYESAVESSTRLNFGAFIDESSVTLKVQNKGEYALTNLKAETPDYITVKGLPATLQAGGSAEVTLLMTGQPGYKEGKVTFNADNAISSYDVNFNGIVVKEGVYFNDFESGDLTGWYQPSSYNEWEILNYDATWRNLSEEFYALDYGKNNRGLAISWSNSPEHYIYTPKMEFEAGDAISFVAAKQQNSGENVKLVVKYSADRENWQELATITVANDDENLQFSAGSADDPANGGRYVMKYFSIPVPRGEYYIAFGAGDAAIDNFQGGKLVDVDYDVIAESISAYDEATVNHPLKVTANFKNIGANAIPSAGQTVSLLEDGNVVETVAEPRGIASGNSTSYEFEYYPHKEGVKNISVELAVGDYAVETSSVAVSVRPEAVSANYQIGEYTVRAGYNDYEYEEAVPIHPWWYNSKSEFVYKKDDLKDLAPGTKINKISYPYYAQADASSETVNVWMMNTKESQANPSFTDTSKMTLVFTQNNYVIKAKGDSRNPEQMEMELQTPFVYDGDNIMVVVEAISPNKSSSTKKVLNAVDRSKTDHTIYYRNSDKYDDYLTDRSLTKSEINMFPIINLYCEAASAPVTGTVKDAAGQPIEGASVKAYSGKVEYETLTDADGQWELEIVQSDLEYQIVASAEGFEPSEPTALDLATGADIVLEEVEIVTAPTTGSYTSVASKDNDGYFDITVNWAFDAVPDARIVTHPIEEYKYNVYLNGEKHNEEVVEGMSYTLENVAEGDHTIGIASVSPSGKESDKLLIAIEGKTLGVISVITDGKVRYYDLNGVEVDASNLKSGIYIRVEGKKAEKLIIKN